VYALCLCDAAIVAQSGNVTEITHAKEMLVIKIPFQACRSAIGNRSRGSSEPGGDRVVPVLSARRPVVELRWARTDDGRLKMQWYSTF
jgi:hypothetical protein